MTFVWPIFQYKSRETTKSRKKSIEQRPKTYRCRFLTSSSQLPKPHLWWSTRIAYSATACFVRHLWDHSRATCLLRTSATNSPGLRKSPKAVGAFQRSNWAFTKQNLGIRMKGCSIIATKSLLAKLFCPAGSCSLLGKSKFLNLRTTSNIRSRTAHGFKF